MYTPHQVSHVTCHISCVRCPMSDVTCQVYFFFFNYKMGELVGGGSDINRPTLSISYKKNPGDFTLTPAPWPGAQCLVSIVLQSGPSPQTQAIELPGQNTDSVSRDSVTAHNCFRCKKKNAYKMYECLEVYNIFKGHPPSADLRYEEDDSISPSTFVLAAIQG